MEAIALIKRQHREQLSQWEGMLEAKETLAGELQARLREAEEELRALRLRAAQADRLVMDEVGSVAAKLEGAGRAMREQEERFKSEEKMLRELAERARRQWGEENARCKESERSWNEREERLLSELHDLRSRLSRAQEQTRLREAETGKADERSKEAQHAVEATLGELLAERRLREEAEADRAKAHQRVAELGEHLGEVQKLWEEERRQWAELWDRERSTWETQRQEFARWEERLRKEREAWHAELQRKEEHQIVYADQLTRTLRESSGAMAMMKDVLRAVAGPSGGVRGPAPRPRRMALLAGALLLACALAARPAWRWAHALRVSRLSTHAVELSNPTALTFDGALLWVSEWSGRLVSLDPADPSRVLRRYELRSSRPYRPSSLAASGEWLWSLDSSQGRIVRHRKDDPSAPDADWPSPGPAPVSLAHDGRHLWLYDAVTRSLYRYAGAGGAAEAVPFPFPFDIVPTSLAWVGEELWAHDSKGKQLLRFRWAGSAFTQMEATGFDASALAVAVDGRSGGMRARPRLWALCGPEAGRSGHAIKKVKVNGFFIRD